jgi:hypothetical protein
MSPSGGTTHTTNAIDTLYPTITFMLSRVASAKGSFAYGVDARTLLLGISRYGRVGEYLDNLDIVEL